MAISSSTIPIFEETCREWVRRLRDDTSANGIRIREDAEQLIQELAIWHHMRPTEEERVRVLRDVLSLHRRALDHTTR